MALKIQGLFVGWLLTIAVSFSLMGCKVIQPTTPTSIQQIQSTMQDGIRTDKGFSSNQKYTFPSRLNTALLPPLSHYVSPAKEAPERFDVTANKIPAKEFFMGLVSGTSYNMVVHPDINGTISIALKNVTIKQTMDAIRDIYGYEYHKTSYGFEVLPPQLETQLFHINYLDVQRTGLSYTQLTTGQISNKVGTVSVGGTSIYTAPTPTSPSGGSGSPDGLGTISSIETKSEMQFWKDIEKAIQNIVGKEGGRSV